MEDIRIVVVPETGLFGDGGPKPELSQAAEQVDLLAIHIISDIKKTRLFHNFSPDEQGATHDKISVQDVWKSGGGIEAAADIMFFDVIAGKVNSAPVLLDGRPNISLPAENDRTDTGQTGIAIQQSDQFLEAIRVELDIIVENKDGLAGLREGESGAPIAGSGKSTVFRLLNDCAFGTKCFRFGDRTITRSVVDQDDLEIGVALRTEAGEKKIEMGLIIIGGDNDANFRPRRSRDGHLRTPQREPPQPPVSEMASLPSGQRLLINGDQVPDIVFLGVPFANALSGPASQLSGQGKIGKEKLHLGRDIDRISVHKKTYFLVDEFPRFANGGGDNGTAAGHRLEQSLAGVVIPVLKG